MSSVVCMAVCAAPLMIRCPRPVDPAFKQVTRKQEEEEKAKIEARVKRAKELAEAKEKARSRPAADARMLRRLLTSSASPSAPSATPFGVSLSSLHASNPTRRPPPPLRRSGD